MCSKVAAKDTSGNSLLHYAVCSGSVESVTSLIRAGAAVSSTNKHPWHLAPLHLAAMQPSGSGLLRPLLDEAALVSPGAISAPDGSGNAPLHYAVSRACLCGSAHSVAMLLGAGVSCHECCLSF